MSALYCVVTTIQQPTECMRALAERLHAAGAPLIVVGDKKGPDSYELEGAQLLSLADQLELPYSLAKRLPTGHYARKNIGYLQAIAGGAACIYETDDDNAPAENWQPREVVCAARDVAPGRWANVYKFFSDELIWPRGFPLDLIRDESTYRESERAEVAEHRAPIQQGLVNGSPDVDAVWRLTMDRPFRFRDAPSVRLRPGTWCPFNTQSTWTWPEAYPLLYLPSYCTFRMTDIWRSFIAQRCLWELDCGIVFHPPEVDQERNVHDLMRDFDSEVVGYQRNKQLIEALDSLSLKSGRAAVGENLLACYEKLVGEEFFDPQELDLVGAWLEDLARLQQQKTGPAASKG